MLISFGNKEQRLPIIIIDFYIGITILLYFVGPIKFHSPYSIFMALYLLMFLVIINAVFFRVIKKKGNTDIADLKNRGPFKPLPIWFYLVGTLIPLVMVVDSILITEFSGLNGNVFDTMAQSYTFVQSGGRYQEGIDVPMWIYMHFAVFVYLTIVDGLFLFKENGLFRKVLWGSSLVLLIAYFMLFRGTQKTLGDVFILCASAVLIKMYTSKRKRQRNWKGMALLFLMVISFAIVLATIMGRRISYLGSIGYDAFKLHTNFWDVDTNYPILSLLSEDTMLGFACLVFYLCNGLCGLSYCLASPFTWTYGLGTFPDLADILSRRFGIDVYENTYMYKAYETFGWHHSEQWHTLFPYLASDWTFIGAIVVMGLAMYVYATCWMEILEKKNKESIYLFSIMNIIWIYLPCNNQIFATRTTEIVFVISFIMWIRRKKHAIKRGYRIRFR